MKAVMLAAGEGKRLRPITNRMPKVMVPIGRKPLIQHNIEYLKKNGIKEILVNLHHLPEKIVEFLGDGSGLGVKIEYFYEKKLLGTAGAVKNMSSSLKETFLVFYGDIITNLDINDFARFHREKKSFATVAVHKYKNKISKSSLIILNRNNRITQFIERPEDSVINKFNKNDIWHNAGIYILESEILDFIPQGKNSNLGKDIFPQLIDKFDVFGFSILNYSWYELGTIKKYKKFIEKWEKT